VIELYRHTADLAAYDRAWCDANATLIYSGYNESFADTGLDPATTYYYKVFAQYINDSGTYYSTGVSGSATTEAAPAGATKGYTTGGLASNFSTHLGNTDEYTPSGDSWAAKTSRGGIHSHGACNLAGYIYNFSGKSGSSSWSNYCGQFDASGNTWTEKTNVISPTRAYVACADANDKGYICGGQNASGGASLQDCDEYDQSGDSYTSKADLPAPARKNLASGNTILGLIYVCGGEDAARLQDCDQYNPSGDSWTNKADTPAPARRNCAASTISDKGYIYGGDGTTGWPNVDCDEYDPVGNSWTNKADMTGTDNPAASTMGSKGYVYGGYTSAVSTQCLEYDPAGNSWATKSSFTTARYANRAASI